MEQILSILGGLPSPLILLILGVGAALENVVPPVPADTFVLLGGFVAGAGRADAWTVFGVVWSANVGSALGVFWLGRRYGRSFFEEGWGRRILAPHQVQRMRRFYERWGLPAIFLSRFLPGFRAVVPAFAGVSHLAFLPVALPVATASAIWYGVLVWLGAAAGRNLDVIVEWVSSANRALLAVAVAIAVALGVWWWRGRREAGAGPREEGG